MDVFREDHIGVVVYNSDHGEGYIESYNEDSKFPVEVLFQENIRFSYTANGKKFRDDYHSSLSFRPWVLPNDWDLLPLQDLLIDTKVLVKDEINEPWVPRHFKEFHIPNNKIICYDEGRTSHTVGNSKDMIWNFWKLAEDKLYTTADFGWECKDE